jgi:hypothetical protein
VGPDFGSEVGSIMVVKKAIYRLKSSGEAFRAHLAETLHDLGYSSTKADPDVWIRPAVKPDGFKYYEMLLVYVDDVLSISHDAEATMNGIRAVFKLKNDLGAQVTRKIINGIQCWTMSSEQYVNKNAQRLPRIDIATEVSLLSSHLPLPRAGHLQQVYHIFGYLKQKCKRTFRRSQTGILIFVNRAPIIWYSKRQNTVETNPNPTYGSELKRYGIN